MFLLDTNVVSEIRKTRPNPSVRSWFDATEDASLFVSVLALGEIERGIIRLQARDERRAAALTAWLDRLRTVYRDRLLPVDTGVAETWGRLTGHRTVPVIDGLLAATAKHHGMTFVTRNVADVADLDIDVLNPFDLS